MIPSDAQALLLMSADAETMLDEYLQVRTRYQAAIRQVQARLESLDEEFSLTLRRNPIHSMNSRLKTLPSIAEKLRRKGFPVSISSAVENLFDIAGTRVICSYIQDIYTVSDALTAQDDIRVLRVRDYIREPKPNGYRSLHLVLEVDVYQRSGKFTVPLELQIRTIAMDFWATLEHSLRYKAQGRVPQRISDELVRTALDIAALDERMQHLHDEVEGLNQPEGEEQLSLPLQETQRKADTP